MKIKNILIIGAVSLFNIGSVSAGDHDVFKNLAAKAFNFVTAGLPVTPMRVADGNFDAYTGTIRVAKDRAPRAEPVTPPVTDPKVIEALAAQSRDWGKDCPLNGIDPELFASLKTIVAKTLHFESGDQIKFYSVDFRLLPDSSITRYNISGQTIMQLYGSGSSYWVILYALIDMHPDGSYTSHAQLLPPRY